MKSASHGPSRASRSGGFFIALTRVGCTANSNGSAGDLPERETRIPGLAQVMRGLSARGLSEGTRRRAGHR